MKKSIRKFIIIANFLFFFNCLFAQEQSDHTMDVFKLNLLSPGLSYEAAILPKSTLHMDLFLASTFNNNNNTRNNNTKIFLDPKFDLAFRGYYNLKSRIAKQKRTVFNSANYLALLTGSIYTKIPINTNGILESKRRFVYHTGFAWGIQRNYSSLFSLDLNLGIGLFMGKQHFKTGIQSGYVYAPAFISNLRLGFRLNQ